MNGTRITIRTESLKGTVKIESNPNGDDNCILSMSNFEPVVIEGDTVPEIVHNAFTALPRMKRTQEYKVRRKIAAEANARTREQNGTTNNRGIGNAKTKPRQVRPKTMPTINLEEPNQNGSTLQQQLA